METKDDRPEAEPGQEIIQTASVISAGGKNAVSCLTVIGQIEGHYRADSQIKTTKYEHVIPQLVKIEQDPAVQGLLILLNTVGGDVEAGLALAELIAGMKTPTVSLVLGGGHSIGVPLAVSARMSFIAESAVMTIHPVRMNGLVLGVEKMLKNFAEIQGRITDFVVRHSKISAEEFERLMLNSDQLVLDMGTELTGEQAVKAGLIDRVGGLSDALGALNDMIGSQT